MATLTLTYEQMRELASGSSTPPVVQDPQGHRYVLLTEQQYADLHRAAQEEERDRLAWGKMALKNLATRADEEP